MSAGASPSSVSRAAVPAPTPLLTWSRVAVEPSPLSLAVASEELFASLQKADPGPTLEEDNDDDADEPPPLLDEDDDPQAASRTPITTRKEPRRHTHRSVIP